MAVFFNRSLVRRKKLLLWKLLLTNGIRRKCVGFDNMYVVWCVPIVNIGDRGNAVHPSTFGRSACKIARGLPHPSCEVEEWRIILQPQRLGNTFGHKSRACGLRSCHLNMTTLFHFSPDLTLLNTEGSRRSRVLIRAVQRSEDFICILDNGSYIRVTLFIGCEFVTQKPLKEHCFTRRA